MNKFKLILGQQIHIRPQKSIAEIISNAKKPIYYTHKSTNLVVYGIDGIIDTNKNKVSITTQNDTPLEKTNVYTKGQCFVTFDNSHSHSPSHAQRVYGYINKITEYNDHYTFDILKNVSPHENVEFDEHISLLKTISLIKI